MRDEAITLAEAQKKYIPIYKSDPHKIPEGKILIDFTDRQRSLSKEQKKPKRVADPIERSIKSRKSSTERISVMEVDAKNI